MRTSVQRFRNPNAVYMERFKYKHISVGKGNEEQVQGEEGIEEVLGGFWGEPWPGGVSVGTPVRGGKGWRGHYRRNRRWKAGGPIWWLYTFVWSNLAITSPENPTTHTRMLEVWLNDKWSLCYFTLFSRIELASVSIQWLGPFPPHPAEHRGAPALSPHAAGGMNGFPACQAPRF